MFRFFRKRSATPPAATASNPFEALLQQSIQGSDYPAGIALLEEAMATGPDLNYLFVLVELKIVTEDFDGALTDLERIRNLEPQWEFYNEFNRLIKQARVWRDRQTLPDYPPQRITVAEGLPLWMSILTTAMQFHARTDLAQAKNAIVCAKAHMPRVSGVLYHPDGSSRAFEDICDTDDLTGPSFVCSSEHGLLDIPFEHIAEVNFAPKTSFPNGHWNPAQVILRNRQDVRGRIFAYYLGTGLHDSKEIRGMGMTSWQYQEGYKLGFGQRDLQLEPSGGGMSLVGLNQITRIVVRKVTPRSPQPDTAENGTT